MSTGPVAVILVRYVHLSGHCVVRLKLIQAYVSHNASLGVRGLWVAHQCHAGLPWLILLHAVEFHDQLSTVPHQSGQLPQLFSSYTPVSLSLSTINSNSYIFSIQLFWANTERGCPQHFSINSIKSTFTWTAFICDRAQAFFFLLPQTLTNVWVNLWPLKIPACL